MANLFDYSQTPASNNSSPPDGAPEGQAPSTLNNCMRQMMANNAGAFNCYTAGGTANAHTITMSPTLAAYSSKVKIAYIPPANNTGAYTVNVNSLGNVSVKMQDGTDPPAGAANSLGVSVIQHNGTHFVLLNPATGSTLVSVLAADYSVSSSTTFADVTNFDPLTLAAGGQYFLEFLGVASYDDANDCKMQLSLDPAPQTVVGLQIEKSLTDGVISSTLNSSAIVNGSRTLNVTGSVGYLHILGSILCDANNSSTLKVQFAQNTSGATASVLRAGSYLRVSRVG